MAKLEATAHMKSEKKDILGYVGDYCIQSVTVPETIETEWKKLQSQHTAGIYQNYDWVKTACETIEQDNQLFIITARNNEGLQFILPMVLEGRVFKTLRWIGKTHANICSGIYSEAFLKSSHKAIIPKVFKIISKSIEGIAQLNLTNQPLVLKSYPNPLLVLPKQYSVNNMYDMDLRDGFDAVLDQGNGKRKRKLWRKQKRVAESMGGYELVSPETNEDMLEAVNEFMALKGKRLDELGVYNIFSEQKTINFFRKLATHPTQIDGNLFKVFQLKIQGKTRAMYALGIHGKNCQAYVNAVQYDAFSEQSPGEMLLYAMIERLIHEGFESFDLGVGDERYKRSWCPGKHALFDTILPLSAYAVPGIIKLRLANSVKRYARNNPSIWLKLKKLRKVKSTIFSTK